MPSPFAHRIAQPADIPALKLLMDAAIGELQRGFLTPQEIEASRFVMGLDTQLVEDGTYFVVESETRIAGCGGWSRRATLFGGDHSAGRSDTFLDPARDAARVRAARNGRHPRRRTALSRLRLQGHRTARHRYTARHPRPDPADGEKYFVTSPPHRGK